LEIDATYENGVLNPDLPLPLNDRQRVKVTVHEEISRIRGSYGMMGWTGDPETPRKIAEG
jgi:predicted DNA-binding antitoxin AbrB/MazE fold protein